LSYKGKLGVQILTDIGFSRCRVIHLFRVCD